MAHRDSDKWRTVEGQEQHLCPGCGEWKPHTAEHFHAAGGGRLKTTCRPCTTAYVVAYQRRKAEAKKGGTPAPTPPRKRVERKPVSSATPEADERALQLARVVRARIDVQDEPQALFDCIGGPIIRATKSAAYRRDLARFAPRLVGVYDHDAKIRDIADDILAARDER